MNKVILSALGATLAIFMLISFLFREYNEETDPKAFKIAIITPISHPSLLQIEQGFVNTLQKENPGQYRFKTYNAQGDRSLLRAEIANVTSKDYDLVFTIGAQATLMSKELISKKSIPLPIVFAAVPESYTSELKNGQTQITGTSETTDYRQQLKLFSELHPHLETLLLVYDPTQAGLANDKQQIEAILKEMNVQLIAVEVFKTNEVKQKVLPFIERADAVFVLKDNTVITALDTLKKLSQQHQKPLFTTDLDSPNGGAGLGFGVHEYDYGVEAAKKALQILSGEKTAEALDITPVDQYQLKINFKSLAKQGLILDPTDPGLPKHLTVEE